VSHETQQFLDLLDQRIVLLEALAETLAAARRDMVCLDVDGLEARIVQQESLCVAVGALDVQLDHLQRQCATQVRECGAYHAQAGQDRAALAARLADTQLRMKTTQRKVQRLNQAHRMLLQRCRRTAGALLNSYATFTATYADPFRSGETTGGSRAGSGSVQGRV
jgi:hypothetical protein